MPFSLIEMLYLTISQINSTQINSKDDLVDLLKTIPFRTLRFYLALYFLKKMGVKTDKNEVVSCLKKADSGILSGEVNYFFQSKLILEKNGEFSLNFPFIQKHMPNCPYCGEKLELGKIKCPNPQCPSKRRR